LRELIGAFFSSRNQCSFCSCAHAPVAAHLLGRELVDEVLHDFETSRLDAAHKELFRYITKLATNPSQVTASDIAKLKAAGWSEEAIYDALTVTSLFKFYNTWNNGSGVQHLTVADYAHSGHRLLTMGYRMDFSFFGTMKVMWAGRKEIHYSDFVSLIKVWLSRESTPYTPPSSQTTTNGYEPQPAPGTGQACAANGVPQMPQTLRPRPASGSHARIPTSA
jgi:hypothetical protein